MATIAYDPTRTALYRPEKAPTLFKHGTTYSDIQIACECARLAYVRAEQSEDECNRLNDALATVGFEPPKLLVDSTTGTELFASIRRSDQLAIIACRGTQAGDIADLATDLNVLNCDWSESRGRVHTGFAGAARAVLPQIQRWLIERQALHSQLILTGHSLGAAVATLIASVLRPRLLVTLGSPRVGDSEFVASLSDLDIQRIANCCDAVTELPPELSAYTHAGKLVYITREGNIIHQPNSNEIKVDRMQARVEYLAQYAWKPGAVLIRDFADHAPINYLRAFFRLS